MRMVFPSQNAGRLFDEFATDMGTIVETLFGETPNQGGRSQGSREVTMRVPMDIEESDSQYTVTLDVPGVAIESVELEVHEDTLSVRGSRAANSVEPAEKGDAEPTAETSDGKPAESHSASARPLRRERSFGKFERTVQLPHPVEHDDVTAELSDGVLVVTLPKADPDKGKRRVPVSRK